MNEYQVDLPVFRGPLDLLLYLVKRHEVDIVDIPIAQITDQYLHYLEVLKLINVEQAGDFLVLASTLMEIKSRMLLPRPPQEVAADEPDPYAELVRQLVEYKKYRDVADVLEERAEAQSARLPRGVVEKPEQAADPLQQPIQQVELWDLVSAFDRLLRATLTAPDNAIVYDETPQHVHMADLLAILQPRPSLRFADLFTPPHSRGRLVGVFLALLELIKLRRIAVEQADAVAEITVQLLPDSEAPSEKLEEFTAAVTSYDDGETQDQGPASPRTGE